MPYILKKDRNKETRREPQNVGELNYAITMMCHEFVESHGLCYATLNAVVGAVESAKAEFQRRVVAPYEDKKIAENGDL